MKIEEYGFGYIRINGKTYENDIIITPDKIIDWWRKESHKVYPEDLDNILEIKPDMVIFGTGKSGRMCVTEEVKELLENKYITVKIVNTELAKEIYNKSFEKMKVCALLHLTC
ncbi:MAG: MTH938/NDUFAF3 family protein [Kosmotogaceae bacterium]